MTLKIKEWKSKNRVQFDVIIYSNSDPECGIAQVRRIKDGHELLLLQLLTVMPGRIGMPAVFNIEKFHEDLIHVDFLISKEVGSFFGTCEINDIGLLGTIGAPIVEFIKGHFNGGKRN